MKVIKVSPRGYCHGVINAINIVKKAIDNRQLPQPIYILGSIIHNKHIVNAFEELGCITLDDKNKTRLELLDSIKIGTVIFTAHGISPTVKETAISKGLHVIDATCSDVLKVHKKITNHLKENYEIIYIGQPNHPETEGIMGISPKINLVHEEADIDNLSLGEKIYVANQTTQSIFEISSIHEAIKKKYPKAFIDNDICNATTVRQEALMNTNAELSIVIGDEHSSNTNKLAKISKEKGIITHMVAKIEDININWLKGIKTVSVTSGASTPTKITNQIIAYLEQFDELNEKTWHNYTKLKDVSLL